MAGQFWMHEWSWTATSYANYTTGPAHPYYLAPVEIIPDKRKVVGLIEHAHEGKICLPNFQRDFVWTREEVADLVRSIIRGYFIGRRLVRGWQF